MSHVLTREIDRLENEHGDRHVRDRHDGVSARPMPGRSGNAVDGAASSVRGAFVVGGALGAVAVARSFGRRGIPVCFLTHDHPIAKYSRYVGRSLTWSGPEEPGAIDAFLRIVREHRLEDWTLFVCGDAEVHFAAQNHQRLGEVLRLTSPPHAIGRWAYDKSLMYQRAAEIGIGSPRIYRHGDFAAIAELDCQFPVILKPSFHEGDNAFTRAKVWRADDRSSLVARYAEAAAQVGPSNVIVQELIPGGGEAQFSFAAVCDRGVPVASLVARRTRQYPIEFGYTSTYVECVDQPRVEESARRILQAIGLSGLVEVEFKFDVRDGTYKILDINPRAWAWIGLGAAAGVDFPWIALRLAHGETIAPSQPRVGMAWMHASRDLVAACQEIWAGKRSLWSYFDVFRRSLAFAAFAKDDPWLSFVELPLVGLRVLQRKARMRWKRFAAGKSPLSPDNPRLPGECR